MLFKKNQSINQQQAPVYFTTATICLACYNSCAYITQVFSFQRGTIILQRQTVEGIPSNGMFSKSLAYPSVRQVVKFTITYNCSTENSIGLFIPSSLSIFHLNFYRQYQRSCHKARTYTDRNFVAKYSQQVLHFDHEVTHYLQSINDSGQSTQNQQWSACRAVNPGTLLLICQIRPKKFYQCFNPKRCGLFGQLRMREH